MIDTPSPFGRRLPISDFIRGDSYVSRTGWDEDIERAIQRALKLCFDPQLGRESRQPATYYMQALTEAAIAGGERMAGLSRSELQLFSRPLGIIEFKLKDRRFVSVPVDGDVSTAVTGWSFRAVLRGLKYEGHRIDDQTRSAELSHLLLTHLADLESSGAAGAQEVHSARRAAIQNWQARHENGVAALFNYEDSTPRLAAYPYVDLISTSADVLVALLVAPLEAAFIDDTVPLDHRLPDVTLGLFDISGGALRNAIAAARPLFQLGFARTLLTAAAVTNSSALTASFGEMATITRFWHSRGADGLFAVHDRDSSDTRFESRRFCEAFVNRMLCRIDGVNQLEVFPFDRAYIFPEAGTSAEIHDRPIEMLVLEASILSNNPADRGQSLTRRERRLRETQDYECNPSQKLIQDEDRFRFFIHSHERGLVLSRSERLSEDEKKRAFGQSHYASGTEADTKAYPIQVQPSDEDGRLSSAVLNLLGRLVRKYHEQKTFSIPNDDGRESVVVTRIFSKPFEKLHLDVLQRADSDGVYFEHLHGLDLERDARLLDEIQRRYFEYLDDRYQVEDHQLRLERARQDNLGVDDARRLVAMQEKQGVHDTGRRGASKVVFISFSSDLHDENMQRFREDDRALQKKDEDERREQATPILGKEFNFCLILVADEESDKNVLQLQHERTDFKLLIQMIMRQIWMDKLNERQYLEGRSRSISETLEQFLHTAKGLARDDAARREIDDLFAGMRNLLRPERVSAEWREFEGANGVLAAVLGTTPDGIVMHLEAVIRDRFQGFLDKQGQIELVPSHIPRVRVQWADVVVAEAFKVAFNNACEAAGEAADRPALTLRVDCVSLGAGAAGRAFVDIIVENSGTLPAKLLERLNATSPVAVGKSAKRGSTGVGIYVSRFQLRETIGAGADMYIQNVEGNRVQCRIRLPAEIIAPAASDALPGVPAPVPALTSPYILYVEDDRRNYDSVLGRLTAEAKLRGLAVHHARSYQSACRLLQARLPDLILTDLNIPRTDVDGDRALEKFGGALLHEVLSAAARSDARPPVWVLTAELETAAREFVSEPGIHGYAFVPHVMGSTASAVQSGVICVMPGWKRPFDTEREEQHFVALLDAFRASRSGASVDTMLEVSSGNTSTARLSMHDKEFEAQLSRAFERQVADPSVLIAADAGPTLSMEALGDVLAIWLGHEGLPDPDGILQNGPYQLCDAVVHHRLLLAVVIGDDLLSSLPLTVRYWASTRNILLLAAPLPDRQLEALWTGLRQESRGVLSALRHDVRNEWAGEALSEARQAITSALAACESLLVLDEQAHRELEDAIRACRTSDGRQELGRVLRRVEKQPPVVEVGRAQVFDAIEKLDGALLHAAQNTPMLADAAAQHRATLQRLRALLGGGR